LNAELESVPNNYASKMPYLMQRRPTSVELGVLDKVQKGTLLQDIIFFVIFIFVHLAIYIL